MASVQGMPAQTMGGCTEPHVSHVLSLESGSSEKTATFVGLDGEKGVIGGCL